MSLAPRGCGRRPRTRTHPATNEDEAGSGEDASQARIKLENRARWVESPGLSMGERTQAEPCRGGGDSREETLRELGRRPAAAGATGGGGASGGNRGTRLRESTEHV
jgi:hypothetical protein